MPLPFCNGVNQLEISHRLTHRPTQTKTGRKPASCGNPIFHQTTPPFEKRISAVIILHCVLKGDFVKAFDIVFILGYSHLGRMIRFHPLRLRLCVRPVSFRFVRVRIKKHSLTAHPIHHPWHLRNFLVGFETTLGFVLHFTQRKWKQKSNILLAGYAGIFL